VTTIELLSSIYKTGFVAGFTVFALLRFTAGLFKREPNLLGNAIVSGLFGGLLWPFAAVMMLVELQAEHGIFWRREGWKPQTERILDVLRSENREMTTSDILKKDSQISEGGVIARLFRLEKEKLVKSRRETDQEVEKYPTDDPRRKYRRRYWRITDAGRRRRVEKRSIWSVEALNPFPRPA
jgi:hypothetical protein